MWQAGRTSFALCSIQQEIKVTASHPDNLFDWVLIPEQFIE
jgi:hypothetical protein